MASKIVVVGDINGQISQFFAKLATLQAKQSFSFALIAGNLFAEPSTASESQQAEIVELIKGKIEVPLPTYFSLGTHNLPSAIRQKLESNDGEVCPNLAILGRKVSIKTSEGFRIVAVGGAHASGGHESMNPYDATYHDSDVQTLATDSTDTDLLITSDWPAGVRHGSRAPYIADGYQGVQSISELCTSVKPRYQFSTSQNYYEREPFFHNGPPPRYVTRFISLAPFGNTDKQKWIYAFSLQPSAPPPQALPEGCTASPFASNKKRKLEPQEDSYNSFRYSNSRGSDYWRPYGKRRRHTRHDRSRANPDECFFCLSNTSFEKHMVGAIGEECYVTVAKGPLTTKETYPDLGLPGHMLIIALPHVPTISAIEDADERKNTLMEMRRYRSALHDWLAAKSKGEDGRAKLGAVTWEISRSDGVHIHWQWLPVELSFVQRGMVEAAFDVEAENLQYPKFAKSPAAIAKAEEGDYFKVMIWSESLRREMVLPIDESYRFSIQFGRSVMAKLLGLESRMDWKTCAQDEKEEEADRDAFKTSFEKFDFTFEHDEADGNA